MIKLRLLWMKRSTDRMIAIFRRVSEKSFPTSQSLFVHEIRVKNCKKNYVEAVNCLKTGAFLFA